VIATLRRPSARRSSEGRRARWRWVWRGLLLVGALLLGYLLITFVQVWLTSRRDDAHPADAIVVLGAAQYDCRPSPVLERRLHHALDLYQSGIAGRIVVTGGKREGDRCTEATAGAEWLMANGVPEADLLRENQGANSWESLAAAARILREQGLTRAVLVTDGYHALRVEAIADELGLDAVVSPSRKGGSLRDYAEETAAVSIGRIIGFGRLVHIDDEVQQQLDTTISTEEQPNDVRPQEPAG
jgi:uncharacterized SAM-binding protein YcdF (DUF218 family)